MERLDELQRKRDRKEKIYNALIGCGITAGVVGVGTLLAASSFDPEISNVGLTIGDHIAVAGSIVGGTGVAGAFMAWVAKNTMPQIDQEQSLER